MRCDVCKVVWWWRWCVRVYVLLHSIVNELRIPVSLHSQWKMKRKINVSYKFLTFPPIKFISFFLSTRCLCACASILKGNLKRNVQRHFFLVIMSNLQPLQSDQFKAMNREKLKIAIYEMIIITKSSNEGTWSTIFEWKNSQKEIIFQNDFQKPFSPIFEAASIAEASKGEFRWIYNSKAIGRLTGHLTATDNLSNSIQTFTYRIFNF